ncbi:MAG: hypothetical protein KF813_00775 [Trueperaceae bacterium]|nr:hypothetical protein [Trueperaceae bacterium]
MHSRLEFSVHALQRRVEREAPSSVMHELQTTTVRFAGRTVKGQRIQYRIVRHGESFWIAPIVMGRAATIYASKVSEIRSWTQRHLLNPEQSLRLLLRFASHRTPNEMVTDELAAIWLAAEQAGSGGNIRA